MDSYETQINDLFQKAFELGITITEMKITPDMYREIMKFTSSNSRYVRAGGFSTAVYESSFGSTRLLMGHGTNKSISPTLEPAKLKDWFDNHK